MKDLVEPCQVKVEYETDAPVRYAVDGMIAWIRMDRPKFQVQQRPKFADDLRIGCRLSACGG